MPITSFSDEFDFRYIRDNPIIQYKGMPFFPQECIGIDCHTSFIISGRYITRKLNKIKKTISLDVDSLSLKYPEPGWLNVDEETIFYFSIKNAQQYRFALTMEQCKLFNPINDKYQPAIPWGISNISKKTAVALFNRKYVTAIKAYKMTAVDCTHLGAAITHDLALVVRPGYNSPVLYYRHSPVAWVKSGKSVTVPPHLSFMKEIIGEHFQKVEIL